MFKTVVGTMGGVITLAFSVAILAQFTPHPYMVAVLMFTLVRSFGLQIRMARVNHALKLSYASRVLLTERVERLEWEVIRLAVTEKKPAAKNYGIYD